MGLVKKGIENGVFPEDMRVTAATTYAATGDLEIASRISKVPLPQIKKWRKEPWFLDLMREVRVFQNDEVDTIMTALISQSLEALKDRIENGEVKVFRDGTEVRVPIQARDLATIASLNIDKRQVLRGEPTTISESRQTVSDTMEQRLKTLAETFTQLSEKAAKKLKVKEPEVVDADFQEVPNE